MEPASSDRAVNNISNEVSSPELKADTLSHNSIIEPSAPDSLMGEVYYGTVDLSG